MTKKSKSNYSDLTITREFMESDEIIEYRRYTTLPVEQDMYNEYEITFKKDSSAHFEFTIRRDGRILLCSIPSKIMSTYFKAQFEELNKLKAESTQKIQNNKEHARTETEKKKEEASKMSVEAIKSNTLATVSIGDLENGDRPISPVRVLSTDISDQDFVFPSFESESDNEEEAFTAMRLTKHKRVEYSEDQFNKRLKLDLEGCKELYNKLNCRIEEQEQFSGKVDDIIERAVTKYNFKLTSRVISLERRLRLDRILDTQQSPALKDTRYPWLTIPERPSGGPMKPEIYSKLHHRLQTSKIGSKYVYNVSGINLDNEGKRLEQGTIKKPSMYTTFVNYCEQHMIDPSKSYNSSQEEFQEACEKMAELHYPFFMVKHKNVTSAVDVLMSYKDKLEKMVSGMFRKYHEQYQKRMRDNHAKVQKELSRLWKEEWRDLA